MQNTKTSIDSVNIAGFRAYLEERGARLIEIVAYPSGQYEFKVAYPKDLGEGFGVRALAEYNKLVGSI